MMWIKNQNQPEDTKPDSRRTSFALEAEKDESRRSSVASSVADSSRRSSLAEKSKVRIYIKIKIKFLLFSSPIFLCIFNISNNFL